MKDNPQFGGDDIVQAIMKWMIDDFKAKQGIDLGADMGALKRLKEEAEKTKRALSSATIYYINLPFITMDAVKGPIHLTCSLTKQKLETFTMDIVNSLRKRKNV